MGFVGSWLFNLILRLSVCTCGVLLFGFEILILGLTSTSFVLLCYLVFLGSVFVSIWFGLGLKWDLEMGFTLRMSLIWRLNGWLIQSICLLAQRLEKVLMLKCMRESKSTSNLYLCLSNFWYCSKGVFFLVKMQSLIIWRKKFSDAVIELLVIDFTLCGLISYIMMFCCLCIG